MIRNDDRLDLGAFLADVTIHPMTKIMKASDTDVYNTRIFISVFQDLSHFQT